MTSYDEKIAAGRQPCVIPGCRRTYAPEGHVELICGDHWQLAPKPWRQVYTRARKAFEIDSVVYAALAPVSEDRPEEYNRALERFIHQEGRCDRLWSRIKRRIVERSMGL